MEAATEPQPGAPALAVQHAARVLRMGGIVRIEDDSRAVDMIAAEAAMGEAHDAFLADLPRGSVLVLTGQRLASLGVAAEAAALHELPLSPDSTTPALVAMLADPTAPAVPCVPSLAELAPTDRPVAAAATELCKLSGLLPAAILAPEGIPLAAAVGRTGVELAAVLAYRRLAASTLRPVSEARVPLADAEDARIVAFRPADGGPEQFAILVGQPERETAPLARLHSECFTGDLLGSLRCDCGEQLRGAIRRMAHEGSGVLLYLAQEGRGIGLTNKLRAYRLQDSGLDTVEANHHLGFENDERDFWAAAAMLRQLGIARVRLLTNNPSKLAQLEQHGIEIAGRVPHIFEANAHNRGYLLTKALKSGHMLTTDDLQQPKNAAKAARLSVV
jgi:GTP cyclohydrolase II